MRIQLKSAEMDTGMSGSGEPIIVLDAEMDLWMARNLICEILDNWTLDEINEILSTTDIRLHHPTILKVK